MKKSFSFLFTIIFILVTIVSPFETFASTDNYGVDALQIDDTSIVDKTDTAISALGDAEAYSIYAPYYFKGGAKHTYASTLYTPLCVNDEAYVSSEFMTGLMQLSNAASIIASCEDVHTANGTSYIPASVASEAAGYEYLYDERGFFIFSDEEFPYVNSEQQFQYMFEMSDHIYRYLCFGNPTGEEFLGDFSANIQDGQHPRILYTASEIAYIKAQTSTIWKNAKTSAITAADGALTGYTFTADCAASNKQSQSTAFQARMEKLAIGYMLTDDADKAAEYADKAIEYMKILSQWDTFNGAAELTIGHWAMGMAIGYDTFYNYMMSTADGQADLAYIKAAILRLPFNDTINAYQNDTRKWIDIRDNFMGVIGGGMISLVLAVADEDDLQDEISYLAENLLKSLEIATSNYYPNGGYYEGISYSEYMLGNLSKGLEALWKCCGTDYELGSVKGFSEGGAFFVYMQTTQNRLNFSDCDPGFTNSVIPFWLAYRYGGDYEKNIAKLWMNQLEQQNTTLSLYNLYFAEKSIGCVAETEDMPLDYYFFGAEAGSFRTNFDSNEQTFVGFHGGYNGLPHDMLDLGQFVFEANGVQWALDLGGDDYDLASYFGEKGYKIYRKNPEGENCLVINPKNNILNSSTGEMSWYGQDLDAYAPLVLFETAPSAAMAAYDLTDAYNRDVTSYTRGYYFGDGRNTLLVQDELTLKATSEIYWFMHTGADIEIINNTTARLTKDGESVLVNVLCSEAGYELKEMDAEPLPTSPVVSGQATNSGITKLAVYIPQASGEVQIAVKLIPESDYYVAKPIENKKISQWTLPEGDINYMLVLRNPIVTDCNLLSADVQLPTDTQTAVLKIDGQYKADLPLNKVRYTIPAVDLTDYPDGTHTATVTITRENGTTESKTVSFEYEKYVPELFYQHSLANYNGKGKTLKNSWMMNISNGTRDSSDTAKLTQYSDKIEDMCLYLQCTDNADVFSGSAVVVEFDVQTNSLLGTVNIECKNQAGSFYMHNIPILKNGKMYNGDSYAINTSYHIRLIIDTVNKECGVYVDDTLVYYGTGIEKADSVKVIKLQYKATDANQRYSLSNLKINQYYPVDSEANVALSKTDSGFNATVSSQEAIGDAVLAVASYTGDLLLNVWFYDVSLSADSLTYTTAVDYDTDADTIKAFVFDNRDDVNPLGRIYYYKL